MSMVNGVARKILGGGGTIFQFLKVYVNWSNLKVKSWRKSILSAPHLRSGAAHLESMITLH